MIAPFLALLLYWPPGSDPCQAQRSAASPAAYVIVDRIADTLAVLTICLVADSTRLHVGGYHGELSLPRSTRVVKVERPPGGTRIENTTVAGRVSFAGVAVEGVASGSVLSVTIARRNTADDGLLRLALIDVTDVSGRAVRPQIVVDSMPRLARLP